MAILKHIASKNKLYSGAELYLCYEHDAKTGKPLLDESGRYIPRKNILKDAINCDFDTFAAECIETNNLYHKNRGLKDIKSHDYIISFAPEDDITPDEVMDFARQFAKRFLDGHQVIIVIHADGHNHSGNIHAHIVANSVRKYEALNREWNEKACEYKQGCKHKCTNAMLRSAKGWVMSQCRLRGLRQVDLFSAKVRDDYWVNKRGKENSSEFKSYKEKLRISIDTAIEHSDSLDAFVNRMELDYGVKIRLTRETISYQCRDMKKTIRGKRLGDEYDRARLEKRIIERNSQRHEWEKDALTSSLGALLDKLNKVTERNERQIDEISARVDALESPTDSFITEELAPAAIVAIEEADLQLTQSRKVGSWDEELKRFCKEHPDMDVEEVLDRFPAYYDKLMREAQKAEEKSRIITRGR